MCPGCGGDIESQQLYKGLLCKRCMQNRSDPCEVPSRYQEVCGLTSRFDAFCRHFVEVVGAPLRHLQATWAKRFFLGNSFALLAPTGIGKTTFGLALSSFLAPKRSYLLFPTQLLVQEAQKRLAAMGYEALAYHSNLPKREQIKKRIFAGEFTILITTTNFLYRNFDSIPKEFDFVFVDDVDSVLKSARNIDKVLGLLGFGKEDIDEALKFLKLSRQGLDEESLKLWQEKIAKIRSKKRGTLVVSSATAVPKSVRVGLFSLLLSFEVGRASSYLRNIEDVYEEPKELYERSIELIREFGGGGLIFLPGNQTKEQLRSFVEFLEQRGIKAQSYESFDEEAFRSGEVEVVVGFASYRNPLARGLDMPDTVRYALFVGVPKMEFRLRLDDHRSLYYFLLALQRALPQVKEWIEYLARLRFLKSLPSQAKREVQEIEQKLLVLLATHPINDDPDISLVQDDDGYKVVVADVTGYIQASGRTSRLYAGGLTKGLAYMLVDSQKALRSLQRRVRWLSDEIVLKPRDEVDIKAILRQIDEDRKRLKEALKGKIKGIDPFQTALVVVESPNKARTIAHFYGRPTIRDIGGVRLFEVLQEERLLGIVASKGHLFDLCLDEGFDGVLVGESFIELFEPLDDQKEAIMQALRRVGLEYEELFIATDPDTEGEKIGFDIYLNLLPFHKSIHRAQFHEVTKQAFNKALAQPRAVDEDLVRAQLVRRVADRWIGFEVSKFLQKRFGKKSLSAGRVQSAVLEWIVLREQEARVAVWVVALDIGVRIDFVFEKKQKAQRFYEEVEEVQIKYLKKQTQRLFERPFSTDRMLASASRELRFSPQKTMGLAQELFEAGFITYHRTDSIRISPTGIALAKEYITSHFGKELFVPRSFASSEGAHEAIRPTRAMDSQDLEEFLRFRASPLGRDHLRLYDLIFRTFIASQMREAVVEEVEAEVVAREKKGTVRFFRAILEHGIDLVRPIELKDIQEGVHKPSKELLKRPKVARLSYGDVIEMMRERGVGRPSTYAITLQKLQDRGYVYQKRGVLYATSLGIEVYKELRSNPALYAFVNERYTKELEEIMDRVAKKEADFQEVLKSLYTKIRRELYEDTL